MYPVSTGANGRGWGVRQQWRLLPSYKHTLHAREKLQRRPRSRAQAPEAIRPESWTILCAVRRKKRARPCGRALG